MVISHFKVVDQPDESLSTALPIGLEGTLTSPIITLVGPNGSGKTAFLRMIMSSYQHYIEHVRIPTKAKSFGKIERLGLKRAIDYLTTKDKVKENYVEKYDPLSGYASNHLYQFERISDMLRGESDITYSAEEIDAFRHTLEECVLMTQSVADRLKEFGKDGAKLCSYSNFSDRDKEKLYSHRIHSNYRLPGERFHALTLGEVEQLCQELRSIVIPRNPQQRWKYVELQSADLESLYIIGFSIKQHPFARSGVRDSTNLEKELSYYKFDEKVTSWEGKAQSSGQNTNREFNVLQALVRDFFEKGIYQRPVPEGDQLGKLSRDEKRPLPFDVRPRSRLLILMDEPTTSLDYKASKHFARTLQEMTNEYAGRLQFFVATHDPAIIELSGTQCLNFYETPVCVQNYPPSFDDYV